MENEFIIQATYSELEENEQQWWQTMWVMNLRENQTPSKDSHSLPLPHQSNTKLEFILSFFNQNVKTQAGAENRDFNVPWGEKNCKPQRRLRRSGFSGASEWEEFQGEDHKEVNRVKWRVPTIFSNTPSSS